MVIFHFRVSKLSFKVPFPNKDRSYNLVRAIMDKVRNSGICAEAGA